MKVTATIRILLFARFRETAGRDMLELPHEATTADVLRRLRTEFPALTNLVDASRLARGDDFLQADEAIRPGDELALIPPVSGG